MDSPDYKRRLAAHFDARTDYSRSAIHAQQAARVLERAAPQPGERVLDVATGTGFIAVPAAARVGPAGRVTGVDLSDGMLAQARRAAVAAGVGNVDFVRGDIETLEFPVGDFDLVTCSSALPYLSNVPTALRRWRDWLRPGGRLVFNCWAAPSWATGRLLRAVTARHGVHLAPIGDATGTPERCQALLAAAGFARVDVGVEPTSHYLRPEHLVGALASALDNPVNGLSPNDAARLASEAVRADYAAAVAAPACWEGIAAEQGAFFVRAVRGD